MTEKISEILDQTIVSTYKSGAAGALGASFVARAKPDGYTIAASAPNIHTIATLLQKTDWKFHDLVPVGIYGRIPYLFIAKTVAEMAKSGAAKRRQRAALSPTGTASFTPSIS